MKDKNNVLQKYDKLPTTSIYLRISMVEIKDSYVELFIMPLYYFQFDLSVRQASIEKA